MDNRAKKLAKINLLQKQIAEIKKSLNVGSSYGDKKRRRRTRLRATEYSTYFTWEQKILFVLDYNGKPIRSMDIVDFIDSHDTVFEYKWTSLDKQKMLSTHLYRAFHKGAIQRFRKNGYEGYFYEINPDYIPI